LSDRSDEGRSFCAKSFPTWARFALACARVAPLGACATRNVVCVVRDLLRTGVVAAPVRPHPLPRQPFGLPTSLCSVHICPTPRSRPFSCLSFFSPSRTFLPCLRNLITPSRTLQHPHRIQAFPVVHHVGRSRRSSTPSRWPRLRRPGRSSQRTGTSIWRGGNW
jgi:hypothetical protein